MKVYRKIYATQKAQRFLMITVCAWLLSALEISPVGLKISALLAAASVVLGIICLSRSNVAKKDVLRETFDVDTERLNRISRILFFCCMSGAAVGVILCAVVCKRDFSSTYGTLVYIANVLLPLHLLFVPAYAKAALKASTESSVEKPVNTAEPKSQILRGHNVCLLVLAFLVSYIMLFYAAPRLYKNSAQFRTAQNDYLQNDISEGQTYLLLMPQHNSLVLQIIQAIILCAFIKERMNGIGYQSGLLLPIHDKDTLYNIFGNMFRHKTASYRHQTRIEKIKKKTKLRLVSFLYFIYIYRNCLHLHIQSKVNRYKANLFFQLLQTFHFLCFQELIDTTKMFFYLFIPKFIHFRH